MKTNEQTAAILRAIIRWTTGTVASASIIVGVCYLFPVASSIAALGLTVCLSLFIGLNIALPPLDPEEDWVPVHSREQKEAGKQVHVATAEKDVEEKPLDTVPVPGIGVLPIHHRRSGIDPATTWQYSRPGLRQVDEAHKITLTHRHITGKRHRPHFPTHKETV